MRIGLAVLIAAYVLSQFYRAFLAVLAPVLQADIGATPAELATASGLWFLAFAAMQLPIGASLDRFGPRLTSATLFAVGAGGAAVLAMAQSAGAVQVAMALIGVGCSPVLMATYYIFARAFSPALFGTMAAATIGFASLGNIASSLPLGAAIAAFGWRETMWGMAVLTAAVALALAMLVRDPPRVGEAGTGSVLDILRMPAIWPILAMMAVCYAPQAGLRGLWVGPYFAEVHGYDALQIGQVGLWFGLAMVAGNLAYGPAERLFASRKWVIFWGNAVTVACLVALWATADASPVVATILMVGIGLSGASFGIVIAHGRAFFPPHLMGRGVTLLNLFGILPIGIAQLITGGIYRRLSPDPSAGLAAEIGTVSAAAPHAAIFLFFALTTAAGLAIYLLSQDRTD